MTKMLFSLLSMVAFLTVAQAQALNLNKKQTKAYRTEKAPKIDGELNEVD